MTEADLDAEHRLAVLTSWALFGALSLGAVATGFRADDIAVACVGYAILVAGAISHLVINRIYGRDFRPGEIATAITLFGVAALAFLAAWVLGPGLTPAGVTIGLVGMAVVVAGFLAYLVTRHGLTGAFSMFHPERGTPNGGRRRD